jgi:hypothetical protein
MVKQRGLRNRSVGLRFMAGEHADEKKPGPLEMEPGFSTRFLQYAVGTTPEMLGHQSRTRQDNCLAAR